MRKKTVSGLLLAVLLLGMLMLAFNIRPVKAGGTIYIRPDGTVEGTEKIQRDGDAYTFTDNIYDEIVVERNNTVIDGSGYTLQGTGSGTGIWLTGRSNVTIRNLNIRGFPYGIWLDSSSNNAISGNNATNNSRGIYLRQSSHNTLSRNNITNNWRGIEVIGSSNNSISGNNIANNDEGIWLYPSSNCNSLSENNVTSNKWGITLWLSSHNTLYRNDLANNDAGILLSSSSSNSISENDVRANTFGVGIRLSNASDNIIFGNTVAHSAYGIYFSYPSSGNVIYNNNFINNTVQAYMPARALSSVNTWDNGTEGNYWSDYEESHPNAQELNSSGIWDAPYVIDDNNQDNYPLMSPWSPEIPAEVPFWMQWWFWAIVTAGIAVSVGSVYFLKKRKPPMPTAPPLSSEGTDARATVKQSDFQPS